MDDFWCILVGCGNSRASLFCTSSKRSVNSRVSYLYVALICSRRSKNALHRTQLVQKWNRNGYYWRDSNSSVLLFGRFFQQLSNEDPMKRIFLLLIVLLLTG